MPRSSAGWLVICLLAVGIFLITKDLLVAALVPYLWAGLPAFQSAFWIRSFDPNPDRRNACFWFYLGAAAWRAAVSALGSFALLVVIYLATGIEPADKTLARTLIALTVALAIATLLGLVGATFALRHGVRVFVVHDLKRRCQQDPSLIAEATVGAPRIDAVLVLMCSFFLPVVTAGAAICIFGASGRAMLVGPSTLETVGFLILSTGWVVVLPFYVRAANRIVALSSAECWPEYQGWSEAER